MILIVIQFYLSKSGRSYFEEFLVGLSSIDRASVLAVFEDIKLFGFKALGCQFRQIDGKLWEIKIRAPESGYRFFYVTFKPDHICVLHSYKKQSQKAPAKEIQLAKKRLAEIL